MKVVPIVSGGLDSVTMAYELVDSGHEIATMVSFDYAQRHRRELTYARRCAARLAVDHRIVTLAPILAGMSSALTDQATDVPDGHYAEESMKATIVPGRNLLFIAAAAAVAIDVGAEAVAIGVHGGDHFIYPDCRPAFVGAATAALLYGYDVGLMSPFLGFDKAFIATRAEALGVPIDETWSCYKGGDRHCGTCGTCVERREAMSLAGVPDPTEYEQSGALPAAPA